MKSEISKIEKISLVDEKLETLKTYKNTLEEVIQVIDDHLSSELEELAKFITSEC